MLRSNPSGGFTADDILRMAAGLERGSEHPLAAAIIKGAEVKHLLIPTAQDFQSVTGKGVTGTVEGRKAALGNTALMSDHADNFAGMQARIEDLRGEGQTVMLLVIDGRFAGLIGVADRIKETTPEAIRLLHEDGLRIIMLTGARPKRWRGSLPLMR